MRLPGFPMDGTVHMWLLAGFIQVVSLLCVQWSDPAVVVVEVVFGHFPTSQDPDWYTVSYQIARNLTVWLDPIDRSECSPDCRLLLRLAKEPGGSDITLKAIKNNTALKTKTFHIAPVPLSSLRVEVTTTSTLLTCSLQNRQSLTALSLHNTHIKHTHTEYTHTEHTRSATHTHLFVRSERSAAWSTLQHHSRVDHTSHTPQHQPHPETTHHHGDSPVSHWLAGEWK
ncbi:uncharacterized protein [Salmo salar]|uniref:Uncharacterized protein n=1 Tax=Salmo salar TaxID=8030 RepID=A0ABM3CCA6_SALSA|nr:uncharacterized protein LOC123724470 [Salmo salar]